MKKAFTMLELIFIIILIGILVTVVIPRTGSNKLQEAATQVVSHIRYTQHLAMVDDKFDANDANWYKNRWQIFFASTEGSSGEWAYSIFSDSSGRSTGNPDETELAINPLDRSKYLTGGYSAGIIPFGHPKVTKELNLGKEYDVKNIVFSNSCSITKSTRIAFDYLGRPFRGAFYNYNSAYPAKNRLITTQCTITLSNNSKSIVIAIEPETGYSHIL